LKTISIITPCYNEELNVRELYERVRAAIASLGNYRYEHIFIDNASTDNTLGVLKVLAAKDRNVKVIRIPGTSGIFGLQCTPSIKL
jgi:polyisoprenyl-phosphate glycosyltransferase